LDRTQLHKNSDLGLTVITKTPVNDWLALVKKMMAELPANDHG